MRPQHVELVVGNVDMHNTGDRVGFGRIDVREVEHLRGAVLDPVAWYVAGHTDDGIVRIPGRASPTHSPPDRVFAIEERARERRAQDHAVLLAARVLPAKRATLQERNAHGPEVARRREAQLGVRPVP